MSPAERRDSSGDLSHQVPHRCATLIHATASGLLGHSCIRRSRFKLDVVERTVFGDDEAVRILACIPKADEQIRLAFYVMAVGQHFLFKLLPFGVSLLGDIPAIVSKQF